MSEAILQYLPDIEKNQYLRRAILSGGSDIDGIFREIFFAWSLMG